MAYITHSTKAIMDDAGTRVGLADGSTLLPRMLRAYSMFLDGCYRDEEGRLHRHNWSFLTPKASMTLWITQTGVADGAPSYSSPSSVVTSSTAMFYASMVGKSVVFTATGHSYVIASYTSSKIVVVTGDAHGEASGDTMTVTADGRYALPADFNGSNANPVFDYLSGLNVSPFEERTPEDVDRMFYDDNGAGQGEPRYYSIEPIASSHAVAPSYWLYVYPIPTQTLTMTYRYNRKPIAPTYSDSEYLLGSDRHYEALVQAVLVAWDESLNRFNGVSVVKFNEYMTKAALIDGELYGDSDAPESLADGDIGIDA